MQKTRRKCYDLCCSIGEACSSSATLRTSKLQYLSYPLDWVVGNDFQYRVDLLCSNFERFIKKEDLEYTGYRTHPEPCDIYLNKYNKILFNHDFPLGGSLDKDYGAVKAKYDRRIERMLADISNVKSVLILYMEIPNQGNPLKDDNVLIAGYHKLKVRFPGTDIELLYLTNNPAQSKDDILIQKINENITKITANYSHSKKDSAEHAVDGKFLKKLFKGYKLKLSFGERLKLVWFAALRFEKINKGIGVYLFPKIKNNILRLRFLLFGIRVDFCIGKIKE